MSIAEVNVTLAGHSRIDFDRKRVRKALRTEAQAVRKIARRLVARRAISEPGEFPGKDSGALQRSIKFKILSRHGFAVRVAPYKTAEMGKDFYPAYLWYGTRGLGRIERLAPGEGVGRSNRRRRGERAALVAARAEKGNYVVAPRKNYMTAALDARREAAQTGIREALKDALKPR
ncbi:hypothetical protein [Noviherbaspirillum cavernae]|uniref:hypothetical protein n=1 Tax=Noviherbaspirillum cavernae TaxID=2320862 RepID=UPI0011C395B4|nr:hypothetical protein [Noviherbaspirillum cavernae]